ncbi:MAG TPA: hypothetical protein VF669_14415 [Tepidisphaeraceae bacterium]|jgi:hypothetical protein
MRHSLLYSTTLLTLARAEGDFLVALGEAGQWRASGVVNCTALGSKVGQSAADVRRIVWNLCRKRLLTFERASDACRLTSRGSEWIRSRQRPERRIRED